ncbi:hypothetical protein ASF00_08350 [Sphingomonas sp. Leaf34]|nr:hypothetical protein ASF00_08350 [Sphingomonas sp. Leaf34]
MDMRRSAIDHQRRFHPLPQVRRKDGTENVTSPKGYMQRIVRHIFTLQAPQTHFYEHAYSRSTILFENLAGRLA